MNKTARFQKENSCVEIEYVNLISTIPLDKMRELISNEFLISLKLESAPVYITNFKVERIVPDWMINIYIPDPASPIYRASILNGICSVESMKELDGREIVNAKNTLNMFHFADEKETSFVWKTGKVISLSPDDRLKVFEELKRMNIYQVGRFGVWNRKLLIDSTINQSKEIVYNL